MAPKTHVDQKLYCGKINEEFIGQQITVYGWVQVKRELGSITFVDLRDREGILQIVFNPDFSDREILKRIGREFILMVEGEVIRRSSPNPELFSGQVELNARKFTILSESELPPFFPENRHQVSEELRFKHRYLDLRNQKMQKNFKTRSQINLKIRNYLSDLGFLDIETPVLTKATPEGARDYLVPSRMYKGKMFALPQSPQIFKQLLMISGFDRYYQITKCFRDEDLRADRQPEFTQVDIEMSFARPADLIEIINGLMLDIFQLKNKKNNYQFKTIPYQQSMNEYGTDAPDLRIPYIIRDFNSTAVLLKSNILNGIVKNNQVIKGLVIPDSGQFSRKNLDIINQYCQDLGGKGAIWIKHSDQGFKSSLKIEPADLEKFFRANQLNKSDMVFLIGDETDKALFLAGKLREYLGRSFQDKDRLEFVWITDFPLFFYNKEEKRLDSNHHPFTSPRLEDVGLLDSDPLKVRSIAYDLVLNGVEIGGGSQRIKDIDLQKRIFELLKLSETEMEEKFGFFLKALKYGVPPHLGIALGFDRIMMLLTGEESIREIIAFPKTTSSLCLLTGSPSSVSEKQLLELGLKGMDPAFKRSKK
ncbi:MAG: aspartate--tRNA ligase [Candidatus Aminicenantes bacterium]|nr:aspartate--tRNA ligase [Candidatus Aminicenantes bacterium]